MKNARKKKNITCNPKDKKNSKYSRNKLKSMIKMNCSKLLNNLSLLQVFIDFIVSKFLKDS